jgi:hypothetical protein
MPHGPSIGARNSFIHLTIHTFLPYSAYRRPQLKYDSLEALIAAIQEDVDIGNAALDLPQFRELTQDAHFQ